MEKRWLRSEFGSSECPDTLQYEGKKPKQNRRKSKRHAKGKPHNRGKTAHHGRGAHHGQTMADTTGRGGHWLWWLGFAAPLRFGVLRCFALGRGFLPFLGYFGPLCKLLLILMAHTSLAWIHLKHFSPKLGLNHRNLQ